MKKNNCLRLSLFVFLCASLFTAYAHKPQNSLIVIGEKNNLTSCFTAVKAVKSGNAIKVEWQVMTEFNLQHYEVEESVNGITFSKAQVQPPLNNNGDEAAYSWMDAVINNGSNFYRIRAVQNDGAVKYSAIVNVLSGKEGIAAINVYPNPSVGNAINLQLNNLLKGSYTVSVFNNAGQKIYNRSLQHNGGGSCELLQLDISAAKGLYHVEVAGGTGKFAKKIIVQ